jgi:sarcosine oxidase delta subunit
MGLQERDFYIETSGTRPASYACPHCKRRNEFQIHWVTRIKKDRLPAGADDRDRAQFPKLRNYMIRTDDLVTCPTCRRRFEVPSHQSLVFLADGQGAVQYDPDDDNFGNR